jgi:hypothetical protein
MCVVAKDAPRVFWIILEDVVFGRFRLLEQQLLDRSNGQVLDKPRNSRKGYWIMSKLRQKGGPDQ